MTRPHQQWTLARMIEQPDGRPAPPQLTNVTFDSIEAAEWAVFRLRWKRWPVRRSRSTTEGSGGRRRSWGYADAISVGPGQTINFKVSCTGAEQYRARIVRGARTWRSGPRARHSVRSRLESRSTGRRWCAGAALRVMGTVRLAERALRPAGELHDAGHDLADAARARAAGDHGHVERDAGDGVRAGVGRGGGAPGPRRLGAGQTGEVLQARRWDRGGELRCRDRGGAAGAALDRDRTMAPPSAAAAVLELRLRLRARVPGRSCSSRLACGRYAALAAATGSLWVGFFNGRIDRPRLASRGRRRRGDGRARGRGDPGRLEADIVGFWDFSATSRPPTFGVALNRLDGVTVNLPARAVTGTIWNCSGDELAPRAAPVWSNT